MRSSALLLLGLAATVCLAVVYVQADANLAVTADDDVTTDGAVQAASSPLEIVHFSAYDYLQGEWEVYRHVISSRSSSAGVVLEHSLPVVRWRLAKENTTSNLLGRAWTNGTSELDSDLTLRVEFHDVGGAVGKFQSGWDEDALATLFHFGFHQVRASIPIAAGSWNGADVAADKQASYVFQASSPDRFTILVSPRSMDLAAAASVDETQATKKPAAHDDEDEHDLAAAGPASTGHELLTPEELAAVGGSSYLYVAHRVKVEVIQTWYQKYGTMILLGCFLILNVWMRSRQSNQQMNAQSTARQQAFAGTTGGTQTAAQRLAAARRSGGARLETLPEGVAADSGVKKDK